MQPPRTLLPHILSVTACGWAMPLAAQTELIEPVSRQAQVRAQAEGMKDIVRTANTGGGEVGQRQTREDVAPSLDPLGRIDNRIENRVRSRIRNRLDRAYDQTASANSSITDADLRTRAARHAPPPR